MAFFGVTEEIVKTSVPHPNADRLDITMLEGMSFQFVTGRDEYKPGDRVLYFPLDSVLPQELLKKLGLEGKLAGKEKNRVRTVRLRGEISQGLVGPLSLIDPMEMGGGPGPMGYHPEELTYALGVTKYEPPAVLVKGATLLALPCGMHVYDIDGADRFQEAAERLMDVPVCITEKLEGTNYSNTYDVSNKQHYVNQHRYTIKPEEGTTHYFWDVAKKQGLLDLAELVAARDPEIKVVTLFGEMVGPGIQKNIYNLKEHEIRLFDIQIDGRYLNFNPYWLIANEQLTVPVLAENVTLREWLNGRTIQEASNGKSKLASKVRREGIVITPMVEMPDPELPHGRLILKQRSPEYLARGKD